MSMKSVGGSSPRGAGRMHSVPLLIINSTTSATCTCTRVPHERLRARVGVTGAGPPGRVHGRATHALRPQGLFARGCGVAAAPLAVARRRFA